jgi:hypothetical protein
LADVFLDVVQTEIAVWGRHAAILDERGRDQEGENDADGSGAIRR